MSRFNEGKPKYQLIPGFAQEQYAKVLTVGSKKYSDRNWEKGMKWTTVIASLERHLYAIKRGEDYDKESGLLHSAHVMTNAAMLTEYYKLCPEFDDRPHWYKRRPKIGLDIDEVLADFVKHYNSYFNIETPVESWNYDIKMPERLNRLKNDEEFWMTMPRRIQPSDIPFEPFCYITNRPCNGQWSELWIQKNGFPTVPVITTTDKVTAAQNMGIDWFIDDRFENFVHLNKNGVCCFLWDAPHNQRYDVGHKRIYSFKDLPLH